MNIESELKLVVISTNFNSDSLCSYVYILINITTQEFIRVATYRYFAYIILYAILQLLGSLVYTVSNVRCVVLIKLPHYLKCECLVIKLINVANWLHRIIHGGNDLSRHGVMACVMFIMSGHKQLVKSLTN